MLKALPKNLNYRHWLLCFLIAVEIVVALGLIGEARIPRAFDGFQYFNLQYYFLNNAIASGELPQWLYTPHSGGPANIVYGLQAGIFQNIICLFPFLFKKINFVVLFHLGFLLDKVLLITGTWLLARRLLRSTAAIFFVTVTMAATSLWMLQPWFNFHLYYALPLTLYLFHVFFETGRWRYFLLGQNLIFIQLLGNPPYIFPVITLVVTLYFILYFGLWPEQFRQQLPKLKPSWKDIVYVLVLILPFIALWTSLKFGTESIHMEGRNPDGTTKLENFLGHGGNLAININEQNLITWLSLFLEPSPNANYTLFLGFLLPPLAILTLFWGPRKKEFHMIILIFILLMISFGTVLSVLVYKFWPFMKYYRHLPLLSPLIKLFICLLIGLGIDTLVKDRPYVQRPKRFMVSVLVSAGVIVLLALFIFYPIATRVITSDASKFSYEMADLKSNFFKLAAFAYFFCMFLSLLTVPALQRFSPILIGGLLLLHTWNMGTYYQREAWQRTCPLDKTTPSGNWQERKFQRERLITFQDEDPGEALCLLESSYFLFYFDNPHPFILKERIGFVDEKGEWIRTLFRINEASANHVVLETTVPEGTALIFKDPYHPLWRAELNGQPVAVERSADGHKAVPLKPGGNRAHLYFKSDQIGWTRTFFGLNSLAWVLFFGVLWKKDLFAE